MIINMVSSVPWTKSFFPLWFWNKTRVLLTHHYRYHHRHSPLSDTDMTEEGVVVSLQEWQGWGTTSPLPTMVSQIVEDLKVLEEDLDAHMNFGGNGGKLQVSEVTHHHLLCSCALKFFRS